MVLTREKLTNFIKLSQNENPHGPSPLSVKAVRQMASRLHLYPGKDLEELRNRLAEKNRVSSRNIALSSGSVEMMDIIIKAFTSQDEGIVTSETTFPMYGILSRINGRTCLFSKMDRLGIDIENHIRLCGLKTRVIFVANPNNPTGMIVAHRDVQRLLESTPKNTFVVLDEAYGEYVTDSSYPNALSLLPQFPNLIILRTFSKIYGLAGLRIAYATAEESVVKELEAHRTPFSVTDIAVAAAIAGLDDEEYIRRSALINSKERISLYDALKQLGYDVVPSQANFLLVNFRDASSKEALYRRLLDRSIIVREMEPFGLKNALRISIGTQADNQALLKCLESA
ncbi:MAG: histidinol-phosphate transaminase [Armatimonadetes bacterium]|nr:histidinol-phosphate transaminase [Armatimonadota bacterium]